MQTPRLTGAVTPLKGTPFNLDMRGVGQLPRVDMAIAYADADGIAIEAMVYAGAQGLIHLGLAPGRPAQGNCCIGMRSAKGRSSIQPRYPRLRATAELLQRAGILAGCDLAPHKLRILLMLAPTQATEDGRDAATTMDY